MEIPSNISEIEDLFELIIRESYPTLGAIIAISVYSVFVFIFALGTDEQLLRTIGIGIIWSLLLLSSTLSLRKFYEEDFKIEILPIIHMGGMSYELIVFLKILSHFIFIQLPFLISLPIVSIFFNLPSDEIYNLILTFIIGSLILSCLGSISASMNLLNKTNNFGYK